MKKYIFILSIFLLATSFASASFDLDNYSIDTNYVSGDHISGWINVSFDNEPADTELESSEGGKISLLDFVNKTNYTHTCSTLGCLSDYVKSNPESSKQIVLGEREEKTIGFSFEGVIEEILSISFDVTSTAEESETNQLKIDVLNDGTVDSGNSKISPALDLPKNYGAYNPANENILEPELGTSPLCQEVELKESPGFNIGASVRKIGSGDNSVEMSLYNAEGIKLSSCVISSEVITEDNIERSCLADVLIPERDVYYVCAAKEPGAANYKIKGYVSKLNYKNAGFVGIPSSTIDKVGSYLLFAQPRKFDTMGTINVENTLPTKEEFSFLAKEYIIKKYSGLDCSKNDCYVPIKLISTVPQTLTIDNIRVNYNQVGFSNLDLNKIYDLNETASKITGDYQKINIDGIFKVPSKATTSTYKVSLGDEKLFSEKIIVKSASFNVLPTKTVSNYPTEFKASAVIDEQISKYIWDFGDEQTETTYKNTTSHTYLSEGSFAGSVKFVSSTGNEFVKKFTITVSSPKALIESEINEMEANIKTFKPTIDALKPFEKNKLLEHFNIAEAESAISELKKKFPRANSSDDYNVLVGEILSLDVPSRIIKTPSKKVPFFPSSELMDIDALKDITKEKGPHSDSEISNAIIFWEKRNLNLLISTSDLIITKDGENELILRTFDLAVSPIGNEKPYYVIFNNYDLEYWNPEELEEEGDASYLKMSGEKDTLSFSTIYELDFTDLPITIAPKLSELALIEDKIEQEEVKSKVGIIILAFIALLAVGIGIYMLLHKWYKTKYERYLFKDKTNLYNVMIYVNNSKKQGVSNDEIKKNLRRSGWSNEQIRYIMRKFEGRETGMKSLVPESSSKTNKSKSSETPKSNPVSFQTQGMFKNQRHKL